MTSAIIIGASIIGASIIGAGASAHAACAPVGQVLETFARELNERPIAQAVGHAGPVIVTATPDGSSWTLFLVTPDGQACMLLAGVAWRTINLQEGRKT